MLTHNTRVYARIQGVQRVLESESSGNRELKWPRTLTEVQYIELGDEFCIGNKMESCTMKIPNCKKRADVQLHSIKLVW